MDTIIIITDLESAGLLYLKWVRDEADKRGIENRLDYRENILFTDKIAVVIKNAFGNMLGCGYGSALYFVDATTHCEEYPHFKEKVAEVKAHFREYTKQITIQELFDILEELNTLRTTEQS